MCVLSQFLIPQGVPRRKADLRVHLLRLKGSCRGHCFLHVEDGLLKQDLLPGKPFFVFLGLLIMIFLCDSATLRYVRGRVRSQFVEGFTLERMLLVFSPSARLL